MVHFSLHHLGQVDAITALLIHNDNGTTTGMLELYQILFTLD